MQGSIILPESAQGTFFIGADASGTFQYQLTKEKPLCTLYIERSDAFDDCSEAAMLERKSKSHYIEMMRSIDKLGQLDEEKAVQLLRTIGLYPEEQSYTDLEE